MNGLILLFLLLCLFGGIENNGILQKGDLIFQSETLSEFSDAIAVAGSPDSTSNLRFVHVGIIDFTKYGEYEIIEADPEVGVRAISLESFLKNSPGNSKFVIKRLNINFPVKDVIERARKNIGKKYDWYYLPDNDMIYCSELIYDSYLDKEGNHIFHASPMSFKDKDGNYPMFWVELFNELGIEIPEGIYGTNPNDISSDTSLSTVIIL